MAKAAAARKLAVVPAVPETPWDSERVSQRTFSQWVDTVPVKVAECRLRGHQPPGYTDEKTLVAPPHDGVLDTEGPCTRCNTPVRQTLDARTGLILKSAYRYKPEYKLPEGAGLNGWGGLSAAQRGQLRLKLLRTRYPGAL